MNTPPVDQSIGDRPVEQGTLITFLNRVGLPVLKQVRRTVNALAQRNTVTATSSQVIDPTVDLVLADATAAPLTIELASPSNWIRVKVVKIDASGNAVTVDATFMGNVVLAAQGDSVSLESDGNAYY